MPKPFTPKVVTANLLIKGDAVWLTATGQWSGNIRDAEVITDERTADVRLMSANAEAHIVVGPYLADAKAGNDGAEPVHFREAFRSRGPSNYPHGKQVDPSAGSIQGAR